MASVSNSTAQLPHPPAEDRGKRLAILEQGIRTFAELGFRGTDVQVIADRAGVGKGTVYRYFGNKEELFGACIYEVLLRLERHLGAATDAESGPREKLLRTGTAYAAFFEHNEHYLELLVQDRAEFRGATSEARREFHEKLNARYCEILNDGIAAGIFRPVDAKRTMYSLGATLYGNVVMTSYLKHDQSLTDMATRAIEIFLRGIAAESPQN